MKTYHHIERKVGPLSSSELDALQREFEAAKEAGEISDDLLRRIRNCDLRSQGKAPDPINVTVERDGEKLGTEPVSPAELRSWKDEL